MKLRTWIAIGCVSLAPQLAVAAPSINDMQSCQGLLDFMDNKLDSAAAKYGADDVKAVKAGLNGYNQYIQREIVSPGLLQFNGGDAGKSAQMQKQVDAYKASLVADLQKRFPANQLFADQVVALNNCTQKAVPSGQELAGLKQAFALLMKLTKMQ